MHNTRKNGTYEEYSFDGWRAICTYKDNKLEGPYERYYLGNNQLAIKSTYKNDELDGPYERYHENGQLEIKCTYKDGKLEGTYERYDWRGQLKEKSFYKNGIRTAKAKIIKNGTYEEYSFDGWRAICTYKDNKLEGPYERYYLGNNQLAIKSTYKNDELDGPYERYHENGQLEIKCTYKDGQLDGTYEEYDYNGKLRKKCTYKDGIRITKDKHKRLTQEECKHLTKNEANQTVEDKSDKKTTSKVVKDKSKNKAISEEVKDKSKENEVIPPEKSHNEMRARIIELKESARCYATTPPKTTDDRHALALALNNLRHEFGCSAKKVASHSKTIKALREKVENHR